MHPRAGMIDLHSHILPGVDDGPSDLEESLRMARVAVSEGIETIVATPHVSPEYVYDYGSIGRLTEDLNTQLARREIPLAVLPGAEVALSSLSGLTDHDLHALCLGSSDYLLLESPYMNAGALLEEALFSLQLRGFRPVLAHPERSPTFQAEPARLATLAARGVLSSITAGSMAGQFGQAVRRLVSRLFEQALVHDVASDSHDPRRRPPALSAGFERAETDLPGIAAQMEWFVYSAPAAILAGEALPPAPAPPRPKRPRRLRRAPRR